MGTVRPVEQALTAQFAARAAAAPNSAALQIGDDTFTYGELWRAATTLAGQLRARGVGRNDRVCLLLEKSFDLYAAVWAVWLAGAAYVPLAPSYPAARLRLILERAQPHFVWYASREVWDGIGASDMVAAEAIHYSSDPVLPAQPDSDPSDLAYILFTSGSTGTPKGVMVTHANVSAFVGWARQYFSVTPEDRLSGHSDLTFDLSVFDTFVAHCSGSCLVPVLTGFDRSTPGALIRSQRISVWFSVPSVLSAMTTLGDATADNLGGLRWMAFCGEALLPGPIRQVMHAVPKLRVANLYGPTEATVACAAFEVTRPPDEREDAVPFGWRTAGTEVFVWTDQSRVASVGEYGEIYIVGDQVGRGYFEDAEESARRFVVDPRGTGAASFRTGDIATVRADGPVFNFRVDHQIKFRGWRIELGDVERALASVPGALECAAALIRREGKPDALAAFMRISDPTTAPIILRHLRQRLPEHMIPTHVRIVNDFPRTLNQKIDRARLSELL